MDELERAAQESLRLNHILLLSTIITLLEQAKDIDEARAQIKLLLMAYME